MVNPDPIIHYCSLIQEFINEGGAKIKDMRTGITSDMPGRWTISAFDTKHKNKNETPEMKEEKDQNVSANIE